MKNEGRMADFDPACQFKYDFNRDSDSAKIIRIRVGFCTQQIINHEMVVYPVINLTRGSDPAIMPDWILI